MLLLLLLSWLSWLSSLSSLSGMVVVLHDNDNNEAGDDCFGANVGNDADNDFSVVQCVLQRPSKLKKQCNVFSVCLNPRSHVCSW